MKVNLSHLFGGLSIIILGSLTAIPASAQYENDPPTNELKDSNQNPDVSPADDKLPMEHDSKSTKVRDSTHVHSPTLAVSRAKSADQAKPSASKEDDDVLSFNFLYYIIQKFKISDLIDE